MFEVRTDLAVEENERITKAQEETKGISVTEEDYGGRTDPHYDGADHYREWCKNRWENRKELILHWKQLR